MTAKQMKDRFLVPAVLALVFGAGGGWTRQQLHDRSQDTAIDSLSVEMRRGFERLDHKIDTLSTHQRQLYCLTVPPTYREGCRLVP